MEDRPKLKARRFSKFSSTRTRPALDKPLTSLDTHTVESASAVRRFKRNLPESEDFQSKRQCFSSVQSDTFINVVKPLYKKNMAESRMKRIRDKIKAEVASKQYISVPTKQNCTQNNDKNSTRLPSGSKDKHSVSMCKTKFNFNSNYASSTVESSSVLKSSPSNASKNLADERLKRVRKSLELKDVDLHRVNVKNETTSALSHCSVTNSSNTSLNISCDKNRNSQKETKIEVNISVSSKKPSPKHSISSSTMWTHTNVPEKTTVKRNVYRNMDNNAGTSASQQDVKKILSKGIKRNLSAISDDSPRNFVSKKMAVLNVDNILTNVKTGTPPSKRLSAIRQQQKHELEVAKTSPVGRSVLLTNTNKNYSNCDKQPVLNNNFDHKELKNTTKKDVLVFNSKNRPSEAHNEESSLYSVDSDASSFWKNAASLCTVKPNDSLQTHNDSLSKSESNLLRSPANGDSLRKSDSDLLRKDSLHSDFQGRSKSVFNANHSDPGLATKTTDSDLFDKMNKWFSEQEDTKHVFDVSAKTDDSLVANCNDTVTSNLIGEVEEMEWATVECDNRLNVEQEISVQQSTKEEDSKIENSKKSKDVCVVTDTNIFISHLDTVKNIIKLKGTAASRAFIYIPWMVLSELDNLKDQTHDSVLKRDIMDSVRLINDTLNVEGCKVIGQSVEKASLQKHISKSPDDKIIACCMQAMEEYETVVLLSNDMNLRNKCIVNGIVVCTSKDALIVIMNKMTKNIKFQKICRKYEMLFSSIICECAKEAYGDIWSKMDMLKRPPWSLKECLKRFKKYWSAVFKEKLLKHFTKTVDDLLRLLEDNMTICDDSPDYNHFMRLGLDLCFHLKDIEESRPSVQKVIDEIVKIA